MAAIDGCILSLLAAPLATGGSHLVRLGGWLLLQALCYAHARMCRRQAGHAGPFRPAKARRRVRTARGFAATGYVCKGFTFGAHSGLACMLHTMRERCLCAIVDGRIGSGQGVSHRSPMLVRSRAFTAQGAHL